MLSFSSVQASFRLFATLCGSVDHLASKETQSFVHEVAVACGITFRHVCLCCSNGRASMPSRQCLIIYYFAPILESAGIKGDAVTGASVGLFFWNFLTSTVALKCVLEFEESNLGSQERELLKNAGCPKKWTVLFSTLPFQFSRELNISPCEK